MIMIVIMGWWLGSINVVTLRQAQLILGWAGKPSQYVASHLGQLSLPSARGR